MHSLTPDEDSDRLRSARALLPGGGVRCEDLSDGRRAADPEGGRDAPRHHAPPHVLHFSAAALAARRGAVLNWVVLQNVHLGLYLSPILRELVTMAKVYFYTPCTKVSILLSVHTRDMGEITEVAGILDFGDFRLFYSRFADQRRPSIIINNS